MSNSKNEHKIVSTSVASIYSKPSFSSELINQALFWESLIIYDVNEKWYKIKQRDGYDGWIHSFYLTNSAIYDEHCNDLQNLENWYFVMDL